MPSVKTKVALLNQTYRTAGGTDDALLIEGSTVFQHSSTTLTALSTFNTVGLLTQTTTAPAFVGRTLTAGSTRITITAGNGSTANPSVDVASFSSTYLSDTATLVHNNSTSGSTFAGALSVPDDTYSSTGWDGSLEVPTKNAVRDKIETLSGGSGALTLISSTTTTGSAANVTFSSIASTYKDLELHVTGRGDTVAASVNLVIQLNSDTGANYDYEQLTRNGAAGTADTSGVAQTSMVVGILTAASVAAGPVGSSIITLLNYAGTTFNKGVAHHGFVKVGTTTAGQNMTVGGGEWRSTAAITAVKVFPSAGNFVDGTVVSLYGRG